MLNHPIYLNTSQKISLSYSRKKYSSNLSKNVPKRVSHSGWKRSTPKISIVWPSRQQKSHFTPRSNKFHQRINQRRHSANMKRILHHFPWWFWRLVLVQYKFLDQVPAMFFNEREHSLIFPLTPYRRRWGRRVHLADAGFRSFPGEIFATKQQSPARWEMFASYFLLRWCTARRRRELLKLLCHNNLCCWC